MLTVKTKLSLTKLKKMAKADFGSLVKAVVDIEKEIMVVDAELHSDQEKLLLNTGSKQENLWGISLYPDITNNDWIEFDSMINIRPVYGNKTRGVDDPKIRQKIIKIVNKLVKK